MTEDKKNTEEVTEQVVAPIHEQPVNPTEDVVKPDSSVKIAGSSKGVLKGDAAEQARATEFPKEETSTKEEVAPAVEPEAVEPVEVKDAE